MLSEYIMHNLERLDLDSHIVMNSNYLTIADENKHMCFSQLSFWVSARVACAA